MAYLLDTNVFIQAKNLHYGFDFCPAFWEWLIAQNQAERVFSIEQVQDEIAEGADELTTWASEQGLAFFLRADARVLPALTVIANWANTQSFTPAAVSTFLQVADYHLVAYALAHQHILVTHEIPANSINRIKIPSACIANGIRWMTPYAMLRHERARFVLGPQP